jgi:hypothetical protein
MNIFQDKSHLKSLLSKTLITHAVIATDTASQRAVAPHSITIAVTYQINIVHHKLLKLMKSLNSSQRVLRFLRAELRKINPAMPFNLLLIQSLIKAESQIKEVEILIAHGSESRRILQPKPSMKKRKADKIKRSRGRQP